jgi:hypothetical protein
MCERRVAPEPVQAELMQRRNCVLLESLAGYLARAKAQEANRDQTKRERSDKHAAPALQRLDSQLLSAGFLAIRTLGALGGPPTTKNLRHGKNELTQAAGLNWQRALSQAGRRSSGGLTTLVSDRKKPLSHCAHRQESDRLSRAPKASRPADKMDTSAPGM